MPNARAHTSPAAACLHRQKRRRWPAVAGVLRTEAWSMSGYLTWDQLPVLLVLTALTR